MGHIKGNQRRVITRVRRLQGQLEAIVRGVEAEEDCFKTLQTAAACRGAFSGLMLELLEDHIETHIADAKSLNESKHEARELKRILRSYLK